MIPYKNVSEESNVESYSFLEDKIIVKFKQSKYYEYSTLKNNIGEINKMIKLAIAGSGLGTMLATKPYHPHDRSWN
jgi:hypothetical protein